LLNRGNGWFSDPDFYVANYINGNSKLFLNITERKTFVKFKLYGVRSNRDEIGAKVLLYKETGDKLEPVLAGLREMTAGSGYGSISAKEMIFGVGKGTKYYELIKFPSSPDTLRIDQVVAGTKYEINELTGFSAFITETRDTIVRFFANREYQPEIIKIDYSLSYQ